MNFSKTTQYALTILSRMAVSESEIVTSKYLHDNLKIPYPYLRRLLTGLSGKGLIKSGKGRGGGYSFAKKIESIYLSDILAAAGEKELDDSCIFGFTSCILSDKCAMHDKWAEAKDNIRKILQTTNLLEIKSNTKKKIKSSKSKIIKKLNYG